MAVEYSVEVCKTLEKKFGDAQLHRPMRVRRYDVGDRLVRDIVGVTRSDSGRVRLAIEKFVGGGFAGQVYQVRIEAIEDGPIEALEVGGVYAMKILIPPSNFSRIFRNVLYAIGFQGAFQLQCNPTASRAM